MIQAFSGFSLHFDGRQITLFLNGRRSPILAMPIGESEVRNTLEDGLEVWSKRVRRIFSVRQDHIRVSVTRRVPEGERISSTYDRWRHRLGELDLAWVPHLRPESEHRVGAHCFRSPALVLYGDGVFAALIPDISDASTRRWIAYAALDFNRASRKIAYGLEPTRPTGHVYFEVDPSRRLKSHQGEIRYSYDLLSGSAESRAEVVRSVVRHLWSRHAGPHDDLTPVTPDVYARVAYETLMRTGAFVRLSDKLGGFRSEAHHAEYFGRPDPVLWNQVWFNGQRSAYGLAHYGRKLGRNDWIDAARRITATTLSAPSWDGLFPAMFAYEDGQWWGSVPRLNGGPARIQIADAASTGQWLLRYGKDIETTTSIQYRLKDLADTIQDLQRSDGSVPAWVDFENGRLLPVDALARSGETAAAGMFLADYALELGPRGEIAVAARRCAEFLAAEIMPGQRYQDFETFFSCSPKPLDFKDPYSGILPQNSLSLFWTASTMLGVYRLTNHAEFLKLALEATDLLSLYQQIWNPPFLSLKAFGGFGVMNTDAEWSDARQSLFAPLFLEMHRATGLTEYRERGLAALRASFVLGAVPEHESLNPKGFDRHPPGIMPENYGHSGFDEPSGRSDTCWGECGALSTSAFLERRGLTLEHTNKRTHE